MIILFWVVGILLGMAVIGGLVGLITEQVEGTFSNIVSFALVVFCAYVILTIAITGGFTI